MAKKHQCPDCGYVGEIPEFKVKQLTVTFAGMGDKPCWRIDYGTIESFWWGPESPFEACAMMMRHWLDWTPSIHEKRMFWELAKKQFAA